MSESLSITQIGATFADRVTLAPALSLQITQLAPETDIAAQGDALDVQLVQSVVITLGMPAAPLGLALTVGPSASVAIALPGAIVWSGGGSNDYANPNYPDLTTINEALNFLLYTPPQIENFTNNVGTVEIGVTVHAVNLTWALNKTMTTLTLNGASLSPTQTSDSLSGLGLTSTTTYTLVAGDGENTSAVSSTVAFLPRRWWGSSALSSLGSADILALGNSEFSPSRAQTRSMSASAAYLYFAWPSSFGTPAFVVNGLPSTAWIKTTVSATNASGYTQNYDVYRSQYLQNGSGISVAVS